MSTPTLSCAAARPLLTDRLDDLLEPAEAERVDTHVAGCAVCAAALAARARAKSALEGAWAIEAAAGDLAERALERFTTLRAAPSRARRLGLVASHAAALAAGVLLALAGNNLGAPRAVPTPASSPSASAEPTPASPSAFLFAPRRIR